MACDCGNFIAAVSRTVFRWTDRHRALARRHPRWRRIRHAGDAVEAGSRLEHNRPLSADSLITQSAANQPRNLTQRLW